MHCYALVFDAICIVFGGLSHALKATKMALTRFVTVRYMNRCGVGPRLAKKAMMTITTNGMKGVLMFGDYIAAAYRGSGRRRAKRLVWPVANSRLVEFRGPQRIVISGT